MKGIIGRIIEIEALNRCFESEKSEFVVVYGRRRVGKTYLIKQLFGDRFSLYVTGLANSPKESQIANFTLSISQYFKTEPKKCETWMDVFRWLSECLSSSSVKSKKVLFLDEMPWMETQKSDFLTAIEWFWNSYASGRDDLMLIVCGSATTWITKKLLHNRGGLYGRFTKQIALMPFTLKECEEFYKTKGINMTRYEQLRAYMVFGGIPYYLDMFDRSKSLDQNIDSLCFSIGAPLGREFNDIYNSLFKTPERYLSVIKLLANKMYGMTRGQICSEAKLSNSGNVTEILDNLVSCNLVIKYSGFGKTKKDSVYQLVDGFTLFYLRFMNLNTKDEHYWTHVINTPLVNAWSGYAFEQVCLIHLNQIKEALGISGMLTKAASWYGEQAQIDLVIERADRLINLCEMKFSQAPYEVTEAYAGKLEEKRNAFLYATKTSYGTHQTLISPYGLSKTKHFGVIDSVVTLEDLFK